MLKCRLSLIRKRQLRNMTERWELITAELSGTFLQTPDKPLYVLPLH